MELDTIESALDAIRAGELVVVVDDTDRENEGDLIMAASLATPEKIAFMIRHTSGIICVPMPNERAQALNLEPMVANNLDPFRTAFTVTVDYRVGMTTGISATERTATIRALAGGNALPGDFIRPGHIFPLVAREGGVLARSGHTEAGVDLARMAGLDPAGVLAEVVNDDGTVKRLPELIAFAKEHDLRIISIEDLIAYRLRTETFLKRVAVVPTLVAGMNAEAYAYETPFDALQQVALVIGDVQDGEKVPVRIHREQPLADLISRVNGDAGSIGRAIQEIKARGRNGIIIMVRKAPVLDANADGMKVPTRFGGDGAGGEAHGSALKRMQGWREVGVGAQILRDLGVRSIALLATTERQYVGLGGFGVEIDETILLK
ncbi:3,4-dihydroxy 2-butanone 4-phosphate synthase / GTP cyclohydrolase II [Devosia enhydra]|uniref:3,4-dihydroxy-2-butanone 4-phosphate synthase n=1 Tax=Devosia enhydra TaxID=665118 RepID=A0A1K2HU59_9HYPH|nr:3,4-dihydroxy-2-butanone-4-phosphate synthase [Devosia enhydra]SFZ81530.1 3,4-dihydroxy 2-butanone 4-phosphate synthase / GTP cyclohydrolase II [Devosia enhydra]